MKYVGVSGKSVKVQSKQRKLPTKSRSDSSIKSKSDKKSRSSQLKTEKRDRLKEVRFLKFRLGNIKIF